MPQAEPASCGLICAIAPAPSHQRHGRRGHLRDPAGADTGLSADGYLQPPQCDDGPTVPHRRTGAPSPWRLSPRGPSRIRSGTAPPGAAPAAHLSGDLRHHPGRPAGLRHPAGPLFGGATQNGVHLAGWRTLFRRHRSPSNRSGGLSARGTPGHQDHPFLGTRPLGAAAPLNRPRTWMVSADREP